MTAVSDAALAERSSSHIAGHRLMAELMFTLFVRLTDCDHNVMAQDVRALLRLTGVPNWTSHTDLRAALPMLGEAYPRLWTAYVANEMETTLASAARQLAAVLDGRAEDDAASLRDGLVGFIGRIAPADRSWVSRGVASHSPARAQARADLMQLVSGASVSSAPGPQRQAEPRQTRPPAGARPPAAAAGEWVRGRLAVRCISVTHETADVKSFSFVAEPTCLFRYKPGQFVTLELSIDGATMRRSYSVSSSPSRPHILIITVKRLPGGRISNWLHDHMREDVRCTINGPHGEFTCAGGNAEKLLLISAGSGVTPMMSMLRYLSDTAPCRDISFVNSVRSPEDIIFHRELLQLSAQFGAGLKLFVLPSSHPRGHQWHGLVGRLTAETLRFVVPDVVERDVYACGPRGYMQAVEAMLAELGHPPGRYHSESFGSEAAPHTAAPRSIGEPPAPAATATLATAKEAVLQAPGVGATRGRPEPDSILFSRSGVSLPIGEGDVILDVAELNGISIRSSCRSGSCGTCRVRVTSGKVDMDGQTALSGDELAKGYVLSCIARAQGRIIVEA